VVVKIVLRLEIEQTQGNVMAIPNYQKIMLPALKYYSEHNSEVVKKSGLLEQITRHFKLSELDANELLPSGKQRVIDNRTQWAIFYLYKAGLLDRLKRGQYFITDEGKAVLEKGVDAIDVTFLDNYEAFRRFRSLKRDGEPVKDTVMKNESGENPEEALEQNYESYKSAIVSDLINTVRSIDPAEFEGVIIHLLEKMGYGVGEKSVLHLGKSGDGGVDGEISQDALGLEKIYVQAKRYGEGNQVGRPAIQQFVGSLNERKSKKGIFITSSAFSKEAKDYVKKIDMVVKLIDGDELAELMYRYDVGVETKKSFLLKVLNEEYFESL
jgi:restriction system protein